MLRRRITISLAAVAATAVTACGGDSGGDPEADPAALAPAGAPLYVEASLEGDDDFDAIAKKLAGTGDPGGEIVKLIDRAARENKVDISWKKDVDPWIGERVGLFFSDLKGDDAQGAFIAPVKDADKAKKSLAKIVRTQGDDDKPPKVTERTYKDTKYEVDTANDSAVAVTDEYAVFGTEQGIKSALDADGESSLGDADAFKKARDQVDDDGVAFGYVKLATLAEAAGSGPEAAAAREVLGSVGDTIAFSVDAEDNAIETDVVAMGVKSGASGDPGSMLAELPGDAWLAAGTAAIGKQFENTLQQFGQLSALGGTDLDTALEQFEQGTGINIREELAWMGDGGIFVRGTGLTDIGGALVVRTSDPAKSASFVEKLERLLKQIGGGSGLAVRSASQGEFKGITIRAQELPLPIHAGVAGDRFIVAVTDPALEAVLSPSGKLADNAAFKSAGDRLGDGMKPAFFADMAPLVKLIDSTGQVPNDPDFQKFRKALDQLTTLVAGTKKDGDTQHSKLSVGVK